MIFTVKEFMFVGIIKSFENAEHCRLLFKKSFHFKATYDSRTIKSNI